MTKISQLSAIGAGLAPNDQFFVRDISDASTPVKSATPSDILGAKAQAAPTAINTSSGLTPAIVKSGLITSTTAANVVMTLPSGGAMEASYSSPYTDLSLEWYVINLGSSNSITISGSTGHTTVGAATVAPSTSAHFLTRRNAASVYITYRVS